MNEEVKGSLMSGIPVSREAVTQPIGGVLSKKEIERLQSLGRQVRELSELPCQEERKKLWKAVNDKHMIRPVVLTRGTPPDILNSGNGELDTIIEDPYWKRKELQMLMTIYHWNHLRGDMVVQPFIKVETVLYNTGFGLPSCCRNDMMDFKGTEGSYSFKDKLLTLDDDIEKVIQMPHITYDRESTMTNLNRMREIMDGIIDVRLGGIMNLSCLCADDIFSWMTMNEAFIALTTDMDFMKAAAKRYVEGIISTGKQLEELGCLSSSNDAELLGEGGYGYTDLLPPPPESGIGCKLSDQWGVATDEILTAVSPETSWDFVMEAEVPYFNLFKRGYYGCCDRLDHKLDYIRRFKTVDKVSCSPFAHKHEFMENAGSDLVVSFKNNNFWLIGGEFDLLKKELIDVCKWARDYNCSVEMIMKNILCQCDPRLLWKWCDLAMDVVTNY